MVLGFLSDLVKIVTDDRKKRNCKLSQIELQSLQSTALLKFVVTYRLLQCVLCFD